MPIVIADLGDQPFCRGPVAPARGVRRIETERFLAEHMDAAFQRQSRTIGA